MPCSALYLLRPFLGAGLALVDGDRARIAVAEDDHASLLAVHLLDEDACLVAVHDAGLELVLADDAEPQLLRFFRATLVDDDHRDPLGDAALERRQQPRALELCEDDVRLRGDRVVDLFDVVLDGVVRIADPLILPAGHVAEILAADLQGGVPVAERLRHPDELARRPCGVRAGSKSDLAGDCSQAGSGKNLPARRNELL